MTTLSFALKHQILIGCEGRGLKHHCDAILCHLATTTIPMNGKKYMLSALALVLGILKLKQLLHHVSSAKHSCLTLRVEPYPRPVSAKAAYVAESPTDRLPQPRDGEPMARDTMFLPRDHKIYQDAELQMHYDQSVKFFSVQRIVINTQVYYVGTLRQLINLI